MQTLDNCCITKYFHYLLRNIKLLARGKDLSISWLSNILKEIKEFPMLINVLTKLIWYFLQKSFNRYIFSILNSKSIEQDGRLLKFIHIFRLSRKGLKEILLLMVQHLRKKCKNLSPKIFFKLLNNVGFGYDCSNNSDNCKFILIFDQLKEITYLKK